MHIGKNNPILTCQNFENNYYIQIMGIAMGIICGLTLGNVHVYIYEIKWLSIAKPVFNARYFLGCKKFYKIKIKTCINALNMGLWMGTH